MSPQTRDERTAIADLRAPSTIRERCHHLLTLAQADRLQHFVYDPDRLDETAAYVETVIRETYPDLDIPFHSRWRHFNVGNIDRLSVWSQRLASYTADERARCAFDLAITSVLLDAGAGAEWRYHESDTDTVYSRSEGLAIASWHFFLNGGFSSDAKRPWQADAKELQQVSDAALTEAFQVSSTNPLAGRDGRVALMQKLGEAVAHQPRYFGQTAPRLGHLYDYLCTQAEDGTLPAATILAAVLEQTKEITSLVRQDTILNHVVETAVQGCASKAESRQVTVTTACDADLQLSVNALLIEQAIVNLLDNAINYSKAGSIIHIAASRQPDEVMICVQDEGIGIPQEHLPRLFERFYRVDKARSRERGGTGLGLAIVKHIAQVHGGQVTVTSTLGEGSAFTLHLPVAGRLPVASA